MCGLLEHAILFKFLIPVYNIFTIGIGLVGSWIVTCMLQHLALDLSELRPRWSKCTTPKDQIVEF